jgi:hypothetical protein
LLVLGNTHMLHHIFFSITYMHISHIQYVCLKSCGRGEAQKGGVGVVVRERGGSVSFFISLLLFFKLQRRGEGIKQQTKGPCVHTCGTQHTQGHNNTHTRTHTHTQCSHHQFVNHLSIENRNAYVYRLCLLRSFCYFKIQYFCGLRLV